MTTVNALRGASWLLEPGDPATVFTPERLSDEHRLIGQTAREFVEKEVLPQSDRLEQKDWAVARQLLRRAGELGLVGVDVPAEFGGAGLDKAASLLVSSHTAGNASFSTSFGAQSYLAISPILYFGTPDQQARYLPKLASGEMVGAYALSESGSGSDALGAAARAVATPDGFALTGEKMWITNGGFADVFIVFAKVDGTAFTAFIVERGFPGVSVGSEEHKMGLHGSSTTPLILQEAQVPAANLLGEIGKGHKVAFNVLNFGRYKLGASSLGTAYGAIAESAKYAAARRQFGKPIAEFGAIRHKLGEMTVQCYAVESLIYRTAGLLDAAIEQNGGSPGAALAALEEFAVEASIVKVAGSEMLGFVLDENVQIHGGNGFVKDYPAERHYRDARVNRIFEGTNEINRLLIPGMIIRRALKGDLPLIAAARALQDEVLAAAPPAPRGDGPLDDQLAAVDAFKKVALMSLGLAMQHYGEAISDEQEVLMAIADILIAVSCGESAVLRASAAKSPLHADAAATFVNDAAGRVDAAARQVLAAMAEGDLLRTHLAALRRLLKVTPVDTVSRRRRLADETVRRGRYIFL